MADVVVIGAANMDIGALSAGALAVGDSNPGTVHLTPGGVGRNIAHNLCLLGVDTALVTALGEDAFAGQLRSTAAAVGLDMSASAVIPGARTSTYVYVAGSDGDMVAAVNDMAVYERLTPDVLRERMDVIGSARWVVLDANLPEESIAWLCAHCDAPIVADPVSAVKAERLRGVLGSLFAIKPNRLEAERLSGVTIRGRADAFRAAEVLLDAGVQQVYISLSAEGIVAAGRDGTRVYEPCPAVKAVNTTGGGDAMVAALTAALLRGDTQAGAARAAIGAGALTCTAKSTIHPGMSWERITGILEGEEK